MARKGRQDRGLLSKSDATGKLVWYVRLYHEGRERRFGSFKTKTEARKFYEKAKLKQEQGQFYPERYQHGGYELVQDMLDRHMAQNRNKNKKQEALYARWWTTRLRAKRLNAVIPSELEAAMYALTEKGLSPQTVLHYMKFMRHVLNIAVRDDKIDKSPMRKLTLPKVTAGRVRFLSPHEEDAVCEAVGPTYAPWVRLAILTGMRQDEQFSLKWSDVDLERGIITLSETKTGGVQYVRLSGDAKDILRAMNTWERSMWVFPSENPRTHMDARNFYGRIWMPAVRQAGIEWATWHDLRHTYASRLAMSGQTEGTIASLLRHSSTALVKRYAHLSDSHLQAAVEGLSGFGKETAQTKPQAKPAISIPTVTETGISVVEEKAEVA